MSQSAIIKKLTDIFHDVLGDDDIVLEPSTTAEDVDGWDSLAHVRLMLSVEKAFGIKFTALEISKLKNVGDLADLVASKSRPA